jgi:hypothetical protein
MGEARWPRRDRWSIGPQVKRARRYGKADRWARCLAVATKALPCDRKWAAACFCKALTKKLWRNQMLFPAHYSTH